MAICPLWHSTFDRSVEAANKIKQVKQEGLCLGNLGETLAEDYASASRCLMHKKHSACESKHCH
ncbi:MAG: hypothetical protein QW582_01995 [Candidatus Micrarchaeaceae archaeon]